MQCYLLAMSQKKAEDTELIVGAQREALYGKADISLVCVLPRRDKAFAAKLDH